MMSFSANHQIIITLLLFIWIQNCNGSLCNLPHCGDNNIACKSKTMGSNCASDARVFSLGDQQNHILNMMNTFRNKVAAGYTRTLFPAGRMARMSWSDELESFALMYARTCSPHPRPCMASKRFTVIGSIYDGLTYTGREQSHTVGEILQELITAWFDDANYVTREQLMHLTADFRKPTVRQVTLLMADRNNQVGCAAMRFMDGFANHFRIACAFATDNMINKPIYKISSIPGKYCHHRDMKYKNLCAVGEKYDNNHRYLAGEVLQTSGEVFAGAVI